MDDDAKPTPAEASADQPKKAKRGRPPSAAKAAQAVETVMVGGVAFSKDEVAAIRAKAEAEVDDELRRLAEKELKGQLKEGARQSRGLGKKDPLGDIVLDLAPYCQIRGIGVIAINGFPYYHGRLYQDLPLRLRSVLKDIEAAGWRHQAEIDGKSRNFYRKRGTVLSPEGAAGAAGLRV